MRSDYKPLTALIEGFKFREPTADGLANERTCLPIPTEKPNCFERLPQIKSANLADLLKIRQSTTRYSTEKINICPILSIFQDSLLEDQKRWINAGPELEGFLFAINPNDSPKGIYRVSYNTIDYIGEFPENTNIEDLTVQKEFAHAGAILSIATNLDLADTFAGSHGYRLAMVRSANAIYKTHLNCFGLGLVGTVFAGFIPAAVRKLLYSDGVTRHQMFAATVGKPFQINP